MAGELHMHSPGQDFFLELKNHLMKSCSIEQNLVTF